LHFLPPGSWRTLPFSFCINSPFFALVFRLRIASYFSIIHVVAPLHIRRLTPSAFSSLLDPGLASLLSLPWCDHLLFRTCLGLQFRFDELTSAFSFPFSPLSLGSLINPFARQMLYFQNPAERFLMSLPLIGDVLTPPRTLSSRRPNAKSRTFFSFVYSLPNLFYSLYNSS